MKKSLTFLPLCLLFTLFLSGCSNIGQPFFSSDTHLSSHVARLATHAYHQAVCRGEVKKPYLVIIDFTRPSNQKRLWVWDMETRQLLFYTYVSHGVNTGKRYATHFSNRVNSLQSSLGVMLTANTYEGNNGYSLRLHGLEPGINDHVLKRLIVIHGAYYVGADYMAKHHGQMGNSWGCFAVPMSLIKPIINTIKGGALLFAYYPDPHWIHQSPYLASLRQHHQPCHPVLTSLR